jgi:broad specificity phosphatase PhoE
LAWYFKSKSQPETVTETRKRISIFLDHIDWTKENILVVFHGFMIYNFQKELRRRGFEGEKLKLVKNGVLYEYVREEEQKEVLNNENNADLCG